MKTYRLLDPDKDQKIFSQILKQFLAYEKTTNNRNYLYEQMEKKCRFYLQSFTRDNLENFAVAGEFTDNKITGVAVGYTFQVAWNSPTKPMPTWVLGLTFTEEMLNGNPNNKLNKITDILSEHFESLHYNSFHIAIRISNRITKENWSRYQRKSLSPYFSDRYSVYVEKLITCQEDIDSFKFINLKTLINPIYHRNLAILLLVLNNELRHK